MKLGATHRLILRLFGIGMACFGSASSAYPPSFVPFAIVPLCVGASCQSGLKVLDDKFFEKSADTGAARTSENGRDVELYPASSRRERDEWSRACESKKRVSYVAFKKCYVGMRDAAEVRRRQEAAETDALPRATVPRFNPRLPFYP